MADTSIPRRRALVMGLGPHLPEETRATVMQQIEDDTKAAAKLGFDYTVVWVDPNDTAGTLANAKAAANQGPWDVYSIGYAVRAIKSITPLFEDLVTLGREACPLSTKFVFPPGPDAILESCLRAYPENARYTAN